jgi:hypothetical protein
MENELGLKPGREAPNSLEDSIIILMDPDMVLLRPLKHDLSNEQIMWLESDPKTKVVKHGFPIAQQDGYLGPLEWATFNLSYITQKAKGEYVEPPDFKGAFTHYISGVSAS